MMNESKNKKVPEGSEGVSEAASARWECKTPKRQKREWMNENGGMD